MGWSGVVQVVEVVRLLNKGCVGQGAGWSEPQGPRGRVGQMGGLVHGSRRVGWLVKEVSWSGGVVGQGGGLVDGMGWSRVGWVGQGDPLTPPEQEHRQLKSTPRDECQSNMQFSNPRGGCTDRSNPPPDQGTPLLLLRNGE